MYALISFTGALTTDRCNFAAMMNGKKIANLRFSLLCSCLLCIFSNPKAVGQTTVSNQILVQLTPDSRSGDFLNQLEQAIYQPSGEFLLSSDSIRPSLRIQKVSKALNIYLLDVQGVRGDVLGWINRQAEVEACQFNHILELRNVLPDDPLFSHQWQYLNLGANGGTPGADLHAPEAWTLSTGGTTPAGDTIVVAVIDAGVNKYHPDLQANLWKNRQEIPADGIDNDQNGYKDDFDGWNVFSQNDQISGTMTNHGTPVSGIIGAVGDNGVGVTGVNWNVKIMFIAGGNTEADILAAYEYILQSRKLYNETNGAKGAFVVAVNCSWGIDYGSPADAPLWCQAFDELGQHGILSIAATTNNNVNVDVAGDLPTTCPSDYLISVTSLNNQDQKPAAAGWGSYHIDLGAYGENVYTLTSSAYGLQSGTSFAAPHVAGAVALLYAAPCPELITLAKVNPAAAANWVKSMVLENAEPIPSMAGITVSNGKLNLEQLLWSYQNQCAACPSPFDLQINTLNHYAASVFWLASQNTQQADLRWRKTTGSWQEVQMVQPGFILDSLEPCTEYEISLRAICEGVIESEWSAPVTFATTGCCQVPNLLPTITPGANSVTVQWSQLVDYNKYRITLRPTGATLWQIHQTVDTVLIITNLEACSSYELQLHGYCVDGWTLISNILPFETSGCGSCLDIPYCSAAAAEAQEEWISSVQLDGWAYDSGAGGGGFQNFTTTTTPLLNIYPQTQMNVVLTPGYWGTAYKEYFRIYIDFNMDGDFIDPGELAFDPGFAQEGIVSGILTTPVFNTSGRSRMRVMMKFGENNQPPPNPCGTFDFGQVEDYCVNLETSLTPARIDIDTAGQIRIFPQPARDWAWVELPGESEEPIDLQVFNLAGNLKFSGAPVYERGRAIYLNIADWPAGIYLVLGKNDGTLFYGKLIKS